MVTRCRQLAIVAGAILIVAAPACEQSPLLAPSGSTITLTAPTNALSGGSSVEIVAQVLEPSGTPPHSGTEVTFTTTLGTVSPPTAETDASGRAVARFQAAGSNGTAVITATSGGAATSATGTLRIMVGSASVGAVRVGANPASVSALGGSTTISASVLDVNGNVLPQVPVTFTTSAGTLSSQLVISDANGIAQTFLTTAQQATVTASVGAQGGSSTTTPPSTGTGNGGTTTPTTPTAPASSGQASGSVTVTVNAQATLVITPPTTQPSAGLPSTYTFAVTPAASNGSAIRSLDVDWGDGITQPLGAVTGTASVQHTYLDTKSYTITATLTDANGSTQRVSTSVRVIPVVPPTINITPSIPASCIATSSTNPCAVSFLLQVTPPTGVGVINVHVEFSDPDVQQIKPNPPRQDIAGLTGSQTVRSTYYVKGEQTIYVIVSDTLSRDTRGQVTITIP